MELATQVLSSGALPLERYAYTMNKSFPDVLRAAGKGVVKRAMGITPPGNDPGRDGGLTLNDRRRGEATIVRDMSAIFVPVRLKGKRRERWPDPKRIHSERFRSGSRYGSRLTRGQKQAYYVDIRKLKTLYRDLASHVGRLAAGWMPAAAALDASAPVWVSRHGLGRGNVQLNLTGRELSIVAVNNAPNAPSWAVAETQRRIPNALKYQANAMQRSMLGYLSRLAVAAGLATSISA